MANNNHVTKADLKALRDELKGDMKALRDELIEAIRDVETKLLKAFYGFAESTQERISNNEGATDGLKKRLATLERRITDLEKRINFPHASP
ncbi:MAG: hypothetical protein HY313_08845 [Acidobacteria bacterium]|nr:hypothetical protein [Acidobacteriota bacterium]